MSVSVSVCVYVCVCVCVYVCVHMCVCGVCVWCVCIEEQEDGQIMTTDMQVLHYTV